MRVIQLTFVMIFGRDRKDGMLNIFILVDLRLVQGLVEVGRVVILVGDTDAYELCNWNK